MDAAEEEQDVKLQRASADLLADFQSSIQAFIWKTTTTGKVRIRRRVRVRETDRLVALLEPFQELPQLLDPHLEKFLPVISDAFLACLRSKHSGNSETHSQLLEPLSRSICRLLYTFCKIRGEKVVVRFLSTETRHLEVLLSAIEEGTEDKDTVPNTDSKSHPEVPDVWSWEERYITLLWLSHLLLAPFDLSTISSLGTGKSLDTNIVGLAWPEKVPGVTLRVVPLAVRYLSSAGKERDAAKVLLVRVAMRKDMQELGIMDALVRWAISRLRPSDDTSLSTYYYVGILSFLAGILNSSVGTADMESYVASIFHVVEDISNADELTFKNIQSSAVARKLIIKILRTIAVHLLQNPGTMVSAEMVENTIGHMLEAVSDTATPVRLAASKALSVITLKLAPDMAAQVVEAVLDALKQNVLWVNRDYASEPRRDLSAINPLEWHGLTLTLSHLLYRRSPPADSLVDIIPALLTALTFEQRSSSGSSIGTNVRDAACFGIWALARRYSTAELHAVPIHLIPSVNGDNGTGVTQLLATELVVCASLDPAGNIRRGASAALQELIGRHPDTVDEGISVVQVVDYHAVALRSRAINEVASGASKLSDFYLNGLIDGLLGWRGVGDADDSTRRTAAAAVGDLVNLPAFKLHQRRDFSAKDMKSEVQHLPQSNKLSSFDEPWARFNIMSCRIENQIRELKQREVDERHGLLLCLASLIAHISTADSTTSKSQPASDPKPIQERFFKFVNEIMHDDTRYRRPELIAESISRLINFALPFAYIDIDMAEKLLDEWLHRNEAEVIDAASEAVSKLLSLYEDEKRQVSIMKFVAVISEGHDNRTGKDKGFIYTLWNAFPLANAVTKDAIQRAMHARWNSGHGIETRATILRCLAIGEVLDSDTLEFVDIIAEGLDDYTTDARGDIGSVVRIAAVRAAARMWKNISSPAKQQSISKMFGKVLRLATEKMDKVRMEAQAAVLCVCRERSAFELLPASSYEYFSFILHMQIDAALTTIPQEPQWLTEMLEGYVSSADTGSEDLVRVSRAALADFCEEENNIDLVCLALFEVLKKNIVNDRILVPTLEVMGFLFDAGILQSSSLEWRKVYTWVQKSHYKTGNIRKLEAAIKMYGSLVEVYPEALQKLTGMLLHPFPKVRNQVADTLFVVRGVGKGVDWGKAGKTDLERLKRQLGL